MRWFLSLVLLLIGLNFYAQERFITIDDTKIWVNTIGLENRKEGQPVVVFESGLGTPMDHWDKILPGVAELAPLVTYDRPGIGKSEHDAELPTIKNVADKLIKLLEALEVKPPYVLVGHSLGGAYVRGFAVYYPELLAGLIIIDPADFTEDKTNRRVYYEEAGLSKEKVDSIIQKIYYSPPNLKLPPAIQEERKVLSELREYDFQEIKKTPLPNNLPVHIITGGRFDMPKHMRSKDMDDEAVFRTKMKHRVARWTNVIQSVKKGMLFYSGDAGHFVHYDDPEMAIASISIILKDYELLIMQGEE